MTNHRNMPQDIKHYDWINLIRSMQSKASKNNGLAVINVRVLIDGNGKPLSWSEPKIDKVEPWGRAQDVLDLLTENAKVT